MNLFIRHLLLLLVTSLLAMQPFIGNSQGAKEPTGLTRYVDPFIGTGFHGHVFMGANVPFGAVQLGPTQMSQGWDWSSGYHYSDSLIVGFAHTHLSGTGIGDLGDLLLMPITGPVKLARSTAKDSRNGYASPFSHAAETARPGYYAVHLQRYNIGVALTATERVGLHQYTFPQTSDAHILLDLGEGVGDKPVETYLEKLNDSTLVGYRFSKGWAADQRLYFAVIFAKPIRQLTLYTNQTAITGASAKGVRVQGVVSFATQAGEKIQAKVGISPVSTGNALSNIRAELPHWDFARVSSAADAAWNKELGKIVVETKDQNRLKVFYTALFHTQVAPSLFNDHNGDYRGTDKQVHPKAAFANMTTFSLWDTYRSAHPLFTITQSRRVADMVNSMLAIYDQQGKLPVWHLVGNETNTMPGNSALPVIADACLKGIGGFDVNRAFNALKNSAMLDERGLAFVKRQGFIPADSLVESVARGLEYAIDDWAVAQVAKKLGKQADYAYFSQRAKAYQYYFDPEIHFMRGRLSKTERRSPFSPLVSRHMKDDFAEGNAWQYTWLVPQDVEGLIALFNGEKAFTQKLDSLFIVKGDMGKEASNDITGLIGQYAHGNEPSHHITYLYGYVGQPGKTADKVRYILDSLYTTRPDGLTGNEDVGQMSAWYVLSAMGFYPVNPANGAYVFGSPVFDAVTIRLAHGKTFRLNTVNNSATNRYINRVWLNGKPYTKGYLLHSTLINGGTLTLEMAGQPSSTWGTQPKDRPRSTY